MTDTQQPKPIVLADGLIAQGGLLRWRTQNGVIIIETLNGAVVINSMEPYPDFVASLRMLADKIEGDHAAYLAFLKGMTTPVADPSASENAPQFGTDNTSEANSSGGFPL